jgi:hypothetical protein
VNEELAQILERHPPVALIRDGLDCIAMVFPKAVAGQMAAIERRVSEEAAIPEHVTSGNSGNYCFVAFDGQDFSDLVGQISPTPRCGEGILTADALVAALPKVPLINDEEDLIWKAIDSQTIINPDIANIVTRQFGSDRSFS